MGIALFIGVFYPFIAGFWDSGPLDSRIDPAPQKILISDEDINTQIKFLKGELKDPRMKAKTLERLGKTNNKLSSKLLEETLNGEKDGKIISQSLMSIYGQKDIYKPVRIEIYRELLKSESPFVRAYSGALFLNSGGSVGEVLAVLETETNDFAAEFIWNELSAFAKEADCEKIRQFFKNTLIENRIGAARILGMKEKSAVELSHDMKEIESDDSSVKIAMVSGVKSGGNKAGVAVLVKFSMDSSVPLRTAVAENAIQDPELEKTLIMLSSDTDFEVRRLACLSLGNYRTKESILTLIGRLKDENFHVRTAGEDSLIKLKPDNNFIEKIAEESLTDPVARNSALRILGELVRKEYSEKIFKILEAGGTDETMLRAIRALEFFDYKKAWEKAASFSTSGNSQVRVAVASALGTFKIPESYDTIRKLDKDSQLEVRLEAIKAIGRTGSSSFADILLVNLTEYRSSAEIRSYACWSTAKTASCNDAIQSALEKLVSKAVIPMEGAPPAYDVFFSRTSAFWALAVLGEKFPEAGKKAKNLFSKLKSDPPKNDVSGDSLAYLLYNFEQAFCYVEKKKVEAKEIPHSFTREFFPVNRFTEKKNTEF